MKLLDQVHDAMRIRHLARSTEQAYKQWIVRYLRFHAKPADGTGARQWVHPRDMGDEQVRAFLTDLAVNGKVAASTQNQALAALLFLYTNVLEKPLGVIDALRAKRPVRVPVVLSRQEAITVLAAMSGMHQLVAELMYGSGMRVLECCSLRVKDIDLDRGQITVRAGKGNKDRYTILPVSLAERIRGQMESRRVLHERDRKRGLGAVVLPEAFDRKDPSAATSFQWQFLFPSARLCHDPATGKPTRWHVHEDVVGHAVTAAA